MIELHEVEKRYKLREGYKTILEPTTLYLPKRNIAVLGANGTGKSTFLRLISGAEKPNNGQIVCEPKVSFPLGFAGSFNGSLSGLENAQFVARIYGQDTEALIDYVKEFSELGEHLYMPVRTYSSGMRARLSFGVSLAVDFECYLVDEITAVGDSRFKKRSQQAFKQKLETANIIMISHQNNTLREYCDMGAVMEGGEMILYDNVEDAIAHHEANQNA